ncbi:ubiquitinyl hydrolase 1 [Coemansia sp. RSA 2711]|nr:ubiquitinyl hydrolase 1 [Coemansia sp. RSA 2711]KAJ2393267.1 ubiquitinyl hydrolase 1 [Coemansia sp. RSA 2611]
MSATEALKKIYWVPLESSPEAMTKMIHRIGVDKAFAFSDVLGLDPELLAMTPQPVHALIFLFPVTDSFQATRHSEAEASSPSANVWYSKQTIGNACGSMAILHALGNAPGVKIGGELAEFFAKTKDLSPLERSKALETCKAIAEAHGASAAEGQTAAPAADAKVDLHYAAFVRVDGHLYELDGGIPGPIDLGESTDLLTDAAAVIQKRIAALNNGSPLLSVLALGPNQDN